MNITLIHPPLGSIDNLIRDIPLSLVYAATHSIKNGHNVTILDLRVSNVDWRDKVNQAVSDDCSLVGLSVMSGNPIKTSLEISRYIKSEFGIPIVWGGPHPTVLPEQTLQNENIDFIIRGWGSEALYELITALENEERDFSNIVGLGYEKDGEIFINPYRQEHEILGFRDIPYDLLDISPDKYSRMHNTDGLVFPILSALGCPYKCTFCMTPAMSRELKGKKWIGLGPDFVLDHMEYLLSKYPILRFAFYDEDSFVDLKRMRELLEKFIQRGLHKKCSIEFRGARINELVKMDDDYFQLMERANVKFFAIGMESGSDRLLKKMQKNITVEQVIHVNKRMAKYSSMIPFYGFFSGMPGETMEDLNMTRTLMLKLVEDNPHCYIGGGYDWRPLPGSAMADEAVKDYGLVLPDDLEGWAAIDSIDAVKIVHPWYTKKMNNLIKLIQVAGKLLDRKIENETQTLSPPLKWFLVITAKLYRPILRFRMKTNYTGFLFEHYLMNMFWRML